VNDRNDKVYCKQCPTCGKTVYFAEEVKAAGKSFHKRCLKCAQCNKALDTGTVNDRNDKVYCKQCYSSVAGLKGFRGDGYAGSTLACVSGGAAGNVSYASGVVGEESALNKGYGGGYRMVSDAGVAGPTSAHSSTVMTEDSGKYLGAAQGSGNYRMTSDAGVAGPTSAHSTTIMTEDSGKYMGASQSTGNYRMVSDAGVAGPTSAHSTTIMTEDSGKYVGTGDVSSTKKFCAQCGTRCTGGRFCANCGGTV